MGLFLGEVTLSYVSALFYINICNLLFFLNLLENTILVNNVMATHENVSNLIPVKFLL